jgi:hypothetical protein
MATIQGLYDTADFLSTQRPNDWREGMLLYYPSGKFPLTALTSVMKKETCKDPQFNWHEKEWSSRRVALNLDLTDVATGLTLVSGALMLVPGTLMLIEESGELIEVTTGASDDTGTGLVIRRSVGTVAAAAVDHDAAGINPYLTIVGTAHEEGVDTPEAVHIQPVTRTNYTQIFRNSLKLTRTAQNTYLRTGEQVKESKREALENHATDMERAWFWGQASELLSGDQPKRTTDGIVQVIRDNGDSDNENDFSGADFTVTLMEQWLQNVFRYGSTQKVCFCGNTFLMVINQAIRLAGFTQYQLTSQERIYGMNIQRLLCPFGEVFMKPHPLFNAMPGGLNPDAGGAYYSWGETGVFIDMQYLKYRPLRNSDTKYLANRQGNGIDGLTSEYLTEAGLEVGVAKAHSIWTGVKSAATS